MENKKKGELNGKELESLILSINSKIKDYLQQLKQKSSEEILNGSITEAQKIINRILPIEKGYEKLDECHRSFLSLLEGGKTSVEFSDKTENDLTQLDLSDMDFTPNEQYRVPILKALIYLGGTAKPVDIVGFIEKEMAKKFKAGDHEKGTNGFEKLWIEMINVEKDNMINEGLISYDNKEEQWEIVQNGIDYLAQHAG
jgi:hypothetical protein